MPCIQRSPCACRHALQAVSKLPTSAIDRAIAWATGHSTQPSTRCATASVSTGTRARMGLTAISASRRYASAPAGPSSRNQNSTANQRRNALKTVASTREGTSSHRLPPPDCRLCMAACRSGGSSASMIASTSRSRSRGPQHHASTATPSSSDGSPNRVRSSSQASSAISSTGGSRAIATPTPPRHAGPPCAPSQPSQCRKPSNRRRRAAAAGATCPNARATSTATKVVNITAPAAAAGTSVR